MRQPWTVDLANLADHAIPLGAAINRWLWRRSPWHREFAQWQNAMEWQRLAFDLEREIDLCGERLATDLSVVAPVEAIMTENGVRSHCASGVLSPDGMAAHTP